MSEKVPQNISVLGEMKPSRVIVKLAIPATLALLVKARHSRQAAKERHAQHKDFRFFKCPGCGTMLRVPRGKGKIHIKCRCGYTLYRKT